MQEQNINIDEEILELPPQIDEGKRFMRVMFSRPIVTVGAIIVVAVILMALLAPLISPYDPYAQNLQNVLAQPDIKNWLGTDALGRDILSRLIYGAQISLMVGVVATGLASIIGIFLGLMAGFFSGWINIVIMRIIDMLLALPPMVLALTLAAVVGGGLMNVMLAIAVAMLPTYTRLMCGQVLSLKESDYVTAARVIGVSDLRIMATHILQNAFPPLLVLITVNIGTAILMEASLSFLGIGIAPPAAAWGAMVNDGYRYLLTNPLLSLVPGLAVMILALSFNLVGDGVRDAVDPRLRGTL
jgi:peptide/nickel transport system permease protein